MNSTKLILVLPSWQRRGLKQVEMKNKKRWSWCQGVLKIIEIGLTIKQMIALCVCVCIYEGYSLATGFYDTQSCIIETFCSGVQLVNVLLMLLMPACMAALLTINWLQCLLSFPFFTPPQVFPLIKHRVNTWILDIKGSVSILTKNCYFLDICWEFFICSMKTYL